MSPSKPTPPATAAWRPIAPEALPHVLADRLAATGGVVRVAVDGAPCTDPAALARSLVEPLRERGRPAVHVRAATFWRDASLRLEYGHEDVESYAQWLDDAALRREVLDAAVERHEYLPSLRDPATNRSTREQPRPVEPGTVVLVSGALLLGRELPFEQSVHLSMSPAALARHTPVDDAWTLPAYARYEVGATPSDRADIVIRMNDARHPALRMRSVAPRAASAP